MARKRYGYGEPRGTQALVDFLTADLGRKDEPCPRHGYPVDPVVGGCSVCLDELPKDLAAAQRACLALLPEGDV